MARNGTKIGVTEIIVAGLVIFGLGVGTGIVDLQNFALVGPDTGPVDRELSAQFCQGLDTFSWRVASENSLNATGQFNAGNIRFDAGSDGDIEGTVTSTAGTVITFATLTVSCSNQNLAGTMYAVASAGLNSDSAVVNGQDSREVTLDQSIADEMRTQLFDLSFTNTSQISQEDSTEATATAMTVGSSRSGWLRIEAGDEQLSIFGTDNQVGQGALWLIDTVDPAAFQEDGITLNWVGVTEIPCSLFSESESQFAADRCYTSASIKPSTGQVDIKWTLNANGGAEPGATSDPTLDICDLQFFVDTDQKVNFECTNQGGTDQGQGTSTITWDNS